MLGKLCFNDAVGALNIGNEDMAVKSLVSGLDIVKQNLSEWVSERFVSVIIYEVDSVYLCAPL